MKTQIPSSSYLLKLTALASGVLLTGVTMAQPTPPPAQQTQTRKVIVTSGLPGEVESVSASGGGGAGSSRSVIKIESIDLDRAKEPAQEVTWLGLSTGEVSEALAAQLGLKPGQGLVVDFVAPDSPAAKAGIQKFDVIEELDDQMLVDPVQLRKLVQMQKEGDTVKLTLYRGGKKQTVAATLAKHKVEVGMMSAGSGMAGELSVLENRIAKSNPGRNKQMINVEVQRNIEEARKAIQEALRQSGQAGRPSRPGAPLPPLPPLADFGNASTVTVTKDGASVKTIVKSDDAGDIVIVANPQKHLTAHDPDGKVLFDGEIETPEQQHKVPAEVWKKVEPLLQQIKPAEDRAPPPHAYSGNEQNL